MSIPTIPFDEELLSGGRDDFHEALVSAFGRYVMWCRDQALSGTRTLVESESARKKIGRAFSKPYEEAAQTFSEEQIRISEDLQNEAICGFVGHLVAILTGIGIDKPIGNKHFARFRLVMELVEKETDLCIVEEVINRDGRRVFAEYLKNWMVEHPWRITPSDSDGSESVRS